MTKKDASISRRASFKLATAVSTLAAGLGATLDPAQAFAAGAEPIKLAASKVGTLTVKLFKHEKTEKGEKVVLVDTLDLASMSHKLGEPGAYSFKLQRATVGEKGEAIGEPSTLVEQRLLVAKA